MENAGEPRRLAALHAEGHDVLDLEIDRIADPNRVAQAVLAHLDRRSLHAEMLADERSESLHRATERPREHLPELLRLRIGRRRVDKHAQAPVALAHHP